MYIHTKMPGGNTYFNSDCLSFKDCNDVLILFYCKKEHTFTDFSTLGNASIQTKNQGFLALNQLSKTKANIYLSKDLKTQTDITGGKSLDIAYPS